MYKIKLKNDCLKIIITEKNKNLLLQEKIKLLPSLSFFLSFCPLLRYIFPMFALTKTTLRSMHRFILSV